MERQQKEERLRPCQAGVWLERESMYIEIYVEVLYFNGFHQFFPWMSPWPSTGCSGRGSVFFARVASQATF